MLLIFRYCGPTSWLLWSILFSFCLNPNAEQQFLCWLIQSYKNVGLDCKQTCSFVLLYVLGDISVKKKLRLIWCWGGVGWDCGSLKFICVWVCKAFWLNQIVADWLKLVLKMCWAMLLHTDHLISVLRFGYNCIVSIEEEDKNIAGWFDHRRMFEIWS